MFVVSLGIDPDAREIRAHLVSQDALDQPKIVIDQGRGLGFVRALLDLGPQIQQHAQVGAEFLFGCALGRGPHDESAGGFAALVDKNPFQALSFFIRRNLAAHSDVRDRGHEDQKAARQGDMRSNARALLGDRLLGNLNQNLLARFQQIADDRQVGGLHRPARHSAASAALSSLSALCARRCQASASTASARVAIGALLG